VIGVEVAKAVNPKPDEVVSTPALAKKYNPRSPEDTKKIPK
jgi:oligogalacturonide lyase